MNKFLIFLEEKLNFEIMAKKWPRWRFLILWDKMAILSPISLNIGLPITLDRNDGQNKLEDCISKNMAKKWLKISRAPLLANLGMAGASSPGLER